MFSSVSCRAVAGMTLLFLLTHGAVVLGDDASESVVQPAIGLGVDQVFTAEQVDFQKEVPPSPPVVSQSAEDILNQAQDRRLQDLERQLQMLQMRLSNSDVLHERPRSSDVVESSKLKFTYPTVKVSGFFQLDVGFFGQDTGSRQVLGDIQDDRGFRRARLAAVGDLAENISYMMEFDFAFPGRPSFMDVFVDVHEIPVFGNVRVGQYRMPFGMDELTSVRELTFFERPTMFGLAPFRQTGIGFHDTNADQTVTWAATGFGFPTDFYGDSVGDRGYGTAERITKLLYHDDCGTRVLHAGFDHVFTIPSDAGVFYRNVPEYGGQFGGAAGNTSDVPFFINTGVLDPDHTNIINFELAGVHDSFHWQSEARYAFMNFGGETVTLPSYYIQVGYILTGEVRPYHKTNAVLGRVKPSNPFRDCGGWGAWEVAGRYSYIDFNPAAPFSAGGAGLLGTQAPGGRLNDATLGLNWYLHANLKVQLQYVRAMLDNTVGDGTTDIVAFRTQMDF